MVEGSPERTYPGCANVNLAPPGPGLLQPRRRYAATLADYMEAEVPSDVDGTDSFVTDIQVKPNPHWLEFSKDGTQAYAANHDSNLVSGKDAIAKELSGFTSDPAPTICGIAPTIVASVSQLS
mgnify:CR=1 FL=1